METKKEKVDITKLVKLKNPQEGEENIIFRIANYNEVTRRVYITPVNLGPGLQGQELVSIDDVENV